MRPTGGNAQIMTPSGRDNAISGAASNMISSCSSICNVKLRSPPSCNGDMVAPASASQPSRNKMALRRIAG